MVDSRFRSDTHMNNFVYEISKANEQFIQDLRDKYPDQVAKAIKIFGDGPVGWTYKICGEARGLWERQDPRYSTKEKFNAFVAEDFERTLKQLEQKGMPPELIEAIFELGEIHTKIGTSEGYYPGYGPLSRREHA